MQVGKNRQDTWWRIVGGFAPLDVLRLINIILPCKDSQYFRFWYFSCFRIRNSEEFWKRQSQVQILLTLEPLLTSLVSLKLCLTFWASSVNVQGLFWQNNLYKAPACNGFPVSDMMMMMVTITMTMMMLLRSLID